MRSRSESRCALPHGHWLFLFYSLSFLIQGQGTITVSKTGKRRGPREALLPGTHRWSSINRKVCAEVQPCRLPRRNHVLLNTRNYNYVGVEGLGGGGGWERPRVCAGYRARKRRRRASSSGTTTFPSLNHLLSSASPARAHSLPPTETAAPLGTDSVYTKVCGITSTHEVVPSHPPSLDF